MDSQITENIPPLTRPSKFRKLIKWGMIVGFVFALLLLAIALFLTYFFPSEFVRKELETQGSELLQGRVEINSLSFNILNGLELKKVNYSKQENRIVEFERLNLDYSLLGLLGGKLTINEISEEHAHNSHNLPELAGVPRPAEKPQPTQPSDEPTVISPLPVSIDLDSLVIYDSHIDMVITPTLATALHTLNVNISGRVEKDKAELDGNVRIANMAVDMNNKHIELPLEMSFLIAADLSEQHVDLDYLTIQSDSHIQFSLSGQLERIFGNPDIDLALNDTRFDIDPILVLVNDFVSPDLAKITLAGLLSPTVDVKGSLDDSGFQGRIDGTVAAQNITATAPQFSSTVEDLDFSLILSNLSVKDNIPEFGSITLDLSNHHSQYEQYDIHDLKVSASTEYFAAGPVSGSIKTTGIASTPALGQIQALSLPFEILLDAKGNHKTQDLSINNLAMWIEKFFTLKAQGGFHPQITKPQQSNVSLRARLTPQIHHILPLIPKNFLEGITILKEPGSDTLTMNLTGFLKKDLTPQWVKASSSVKLTNLTAAMETLPAQGTVQQMNVLFSTGYNATSGQIGGTIGLAIQASNLEQGKTLSVDSTDIRLKSTFLGHVSSSWELTDLRSQDLVKATFGTIAFTDPLLQATLEQIKVSAKTKEDIFNNHFVVEQLGMTSNELLDLSMKGAYRMNKQEFVFHADMPFLKVGNLLTKLSGELVQSVKELNPSGTIAMTLQSSGQIPEQDELDSPSFPLQTKLSLNLQDVEGAFADHLVRGANGTIGASYSPGDQPLIRVASDLRVNEIELGPDLPLSHLNKAFTSLNVSLEDFNDLRLHEVRMGIEGADLSLQGNVTGIKTLMDSQSTLRTIVEPLYTQLHAKTSVHLSNFHDLLKQFGMKGSGRGQVDLSFAKEEKGPLELNVNLDTKRVNLTHGTTTVTNLDGKIALQKRLRWNDGSTAPNSTQIFNPTSVLSRLRSITGKQKSLKVESIDLGFVRLSNLSTQILFDGRNLKIQNLAMNLLGGGLGGDIVLTTGKAFGTSARIEAARLDLNDLLTDDLKISGDSFIDATVGLSVFFEETTKSLDLSRTEINLFITHIGQEAVDRLLVFLDPEGSNPTLASARSQVRLANPSRVTIKMVRGILDLEILFSEGLLPPFTLNRFPIGRLKSLHTLTQEIPEWEMLATLMALAGAQSYGIDENEEFMFQ